MKNLNFILLSLLVLTLSRCTKAGYKHYPEVNHYYKFYRSPLKWYDARIKCAEDNATLAMPRNENETNILLKIFNGYPDSILPGIEAVDAMWLGFHDMFRENEFVSLEGEDLQYYYDKWDPNQPDNLGNKENCVNLDRKGELNDLNCDTSITFVCQKKDNLHIVSKKTIFVHDSAYKCNDDIGKCYKVHRNPKKWAEARVICMLEGGNLAIIKNDAEKTLLLNLFNDGKIKFGVAYKNFAYIGFHDLFKEGHFVTVTDEILQDAGYTVWLKGEPNGDVRENCGSLHEYGGLNDMTCDTALVFICERPIHNYNELLCVKR